jgi:Tol biopolymer transport system component
MNMRARFLGGEVLVLIVFGSLSPAAPVPPEKPTLAFVSSTVRWGVIYVVTTDGEARRLYHDPSDKGYGSCEPSWSPDGRKVTFLRVDPQDQAESGICVMDADCKNVKRLTKGVADLSPTWSPDSKHIAFSSSRDGKGVICVMDADGTNVKPLTKEQLCSHPVWSPDG